MAVLTDTNIFLRLLQPHHPHCVMAEKAINTLRARQEALYVTSQNLVELWAAATRPFAENGLGLTIEQAVMEIEQVRRFWAVLPELPLHEEWERIVRIYRVSGKNTHDARLVAAMRLHRIEAIVTFNAKDFSRYDGITVIDPASTA
jgi:predicted nucleic acid-binding protein